MQAAWYCDVAASSQVDTLFSLKSYYDTFISILIMDKECNYFEEHLKFGVTSIVGNRTEKP